MIFRKRNHFLYSLFLSSLLHFTLNAQIESKIPPSLTLENAVVIALENQPAIRSAEAGIHFSEAVLRQARSNFFPYLNFVAGGSHIEGYFIFNPSFPARKQDYDSYNAAIQLQQIILDFNKTWPRVSAGEYGLEGSKFDYQSTRDAVIMNVQLAYYQNIRTKSIVQVNKSTVQQAEKHLEKAKAFHSAGKGSQFDITRAEVDLANANLNLLSAQNAEQIAKVQLKNAMGIRETTDFSVPDSFRIEAFDVPLDSVKQIALNDRPEIRSAQARINENHAFVTAARNAHLPNLLATGSYQWNGFEFPLQSRWNIGVTLNLPIFQGFNISAQVQQAKANVDAAVAAFESLEQQILMLVEEYYLQLEETGKKIKVTGILIKQATENLRLAETRYSSGSGSPLEITDALVALDNAQIANVQAIFDYNVALAQLRRAMGRPLQ
jgi:outer membrane protein TolC